MFAVLIKLANRGGVLKPGMNADVQIKIADRDSVAAVPTAALRADTDVPVDCEDARRRRERSCASRSGPTGQATAAAAKGKTVVARRPRDRRCRPTSTRQVSARCSRSGAAASELTADERDADAQSVPGGGRLWRRRAAAGAAAAGGGFQGGGFPPGGVAGGGPPGGYAGRRRESRRRPRRLERRAAAALNYQFGGDYWVVALRNNQPVPVAVRTGLTDLEYSEVGRGSRARRSRAAAAEREPVRAAGAAAAVHLASASAAARRSSRVRVAAARRFMR